MEFPWPEQVFPRVKRDDPIVTKVAAAGTRRRIQSHQMTVIRPHQHPLWADITTIGARVDGDSTAYMQICGPLIRRCPRIVAPNLCSGGRMDRDHFIERRTKDQFVVDEQRRGFRRAPPHQFAAVGKVTTRIPPDFCQFDHVLRVYRAGGRIAMPPHITTVRRPTLAEIGRADLFGDAVDVQRVSQNQIGRDGPTDKGKQPNHKNHAQDTFQNALHANTQQLCFDGLLHQRACLASLGDRCLNLPESMLRCGGPSIHAASNSWLMHGMSP